jgi:hypothetical protein
MKTKITVLNGTSETEPTKEIFAKLHQYATGEIVIQLSGDGLHFSPAVGLRLGKEGLVATRRSGGAAMDFCERDSNGRVKDMFRSY